MRHPYRRGQKLPESRVQGAGYWLWHKCSVSFMFAFECYTTAIFNKNLIILAEKTFFALKHVCVCVWHCGKCCVQSTSPSCPFTDIDNHMIHLQLLTFIPNVDKISRVYKYISSDLGLSAFTFEVVSPAVCNYLFSRLLKDERRMW